jgi:hypothetical protein
MHIKYNNYFFVEVVVIDSINDLSKINDLAAFQLQLSTKVPKEKRTQNASTYSTGADRAIMHVCR